MFHFFDVSAGIISVNLECKLITSRYMTITINCRWEYNKLKMGKLLMIITDNALELPTLWYHGTLDIAVPSLKAGIDLSKGREAVDFGPGFYLTTNYEQAAIQAKKKVYRHNLFEDKERRKAKKKGSVYRPKYSHRGAVLTYFLSTESLAECKNPLFFKNRGTGWSLFVLGNRCTNPDALGIDFHNRSRNFDFVYGPLADGYDIPTLIGYVENKEMSIEEFLDKISEAFDFPEKNQLSVHTEEAKECLILSEVKYIETSTRVRTR